MGQFLDYLASMFNSNRFVEPSAQKVAHSGGTFHLGDRSFPQLFTSKSTNDQPNDSALSMSQSNKRTIHIYQTIGAIAFLIQLSMVTVPKIQLDSFDLLQPDGWQLVTLSLVPFVVYIASIGAMNEINKPIVEGAKLTSKNSGLDLNNNDFIQSLKIMILLVSICQISSIFSDQLLWSVIMIVPIWCYQLTTKVAQSEYKRYAPSPKKQWVKLNLSRSPAKVSPTKVSQQAHIHQNHGSSSMEVRATPRTRTKKAVKNIITGVSDKYHAFEQNVAHQFSQKLFTPLSPKLKMIET